MSNDNVISKLKAGDRVLLGALYKEYLPRVVSWVTTNSGSPDDAHDVFHDTLEALIHKSYTTQQDFTLDNIDGYIIQIAKNKWIDQLRRKKTFQKVRKGFTERLDSEYNIEEDYISVESEHVKQKALKTAFGKLSEVCQKLLTLIMNERKTAEIVQELDMINANTM